MGDRLRHRLPEEVDRLSPMLYRPNGIDVVSTRRVTAGRARKARVVPGSPCPMGD